MYPDSISQPEDTVKITKSWSRGLDGRDQELPTSDDDEAAETWPNPKDRTPVYIACSKMEPNQKLVALLMEKDPTCLVLNEASTLPPLLHYCCQQRITSKAMLDLVRFVARKCPNAVTTRDQKGNYPCYYLAKDCCSLDLLQEMLPSKEMAFNKETSDHLLHHVASHAHFPKHRMKVVQWLLKEYPDSLRSLNSQGELPLHKSLPTEFVHKSRYLPMALAEAGPFTLIIGKGNTTMLDRFEAHMEFLDEEIAKVEAESNFDDPEDYIGSDLEQLGNESCDFLRAYNEMLSEVFPKALAILFDLLREGFDENTKETEEHRRCLPSDVILGITTFLFPINAQNVLKETIRRNE